MCQNVTFYCLEPCRKRHRSGGDEENGYLVPQTKRHSRGHPLSPEPGRDAWDTEVQYYVKQIPLFIITHFNPTYVQRVASQPDVELEALNKNLLLFGDTVDAG